MIQYYLTVSVRDLEKLRLRTLKMSQYSSNPGKELVVDDKLQDRDVKLGPF